MASLNQKLLINTRLHKALHRNVYLLSLHYPMSKDVAAHFKEGMFEKPNGTAFHHISFYLMSIIDPKCVASSSWAMFEIKMEAKYRSEFLKFVNNTSKEHVGHISHIMPSWIVNAGGLKVAKLMFELSQVALKLHIQRVATNHVNLNINEISVDEILPKNANLREILIDKVTRWHITSQNMKNIADIYQRIAPIIASDKLHKMKLLKGMFSNVNFAVGVSDPDFGRELCDVFTTPDLIKRWHSLIETKILDTQTNWRDVSSNILDLAKKCRNRSDQLVVMHTKHPCSDSVLEYDDLKDKFEVPALFENGLSVTQSAILKSNVKNGVLDFPNMFKSYSVIISHCFQSYVPSQSTDYLENVLEEKKKLVMFIKQQSKELTTETFKFHNQLKEVMTPEQYSCLSAESSSGVYQASNVPSTCAQPKYAEDTSDHWCKCLERFKFLEFKHPFKSEKMPYILEDESLQSHSLVINGLEFESQNKQLFNTTNSKPDYMKHIAELKRNMEKISDVSNKTCLNQHNVMTISRFGTERKQSAFMANHLRSMFTSIKKRPTSDVKIPKLEINNRSVRKTWGNLFNESSEDSSILQKTRSSPNLHSEDGKESKKRSRINRPVSVTLHERISGVKEIDYSSFLSELGSTPNLSSSSQKENVPSNHQRSIVTETVSIVNRIEIDTFSDGDFKLPKDTPPNQKSPKSPSTASLIATYKKFKESRLGISDEKKGDANSKKVDSFLENLDLGHNRDVDKKILKKDELQFLSSVPDLLSPSLDFQIRRTETK